MKKAVLLSILLVSCSVISEPYFPKGVLDPVDDSEEFVQSWYSSHLRSMQEPSLLKSHELVVYRFTWLPTFHPPMIFRITEKAGEKYDLIVKRTDGAGGYSPGKIVDNIKIAIPTKVAKALITKLESECNFWSLPPTVEVLGLDGSQWIFEGNIKGKYHLVDRWSPASGCLREIGETFMKLSKLDIEEVY